MTNQKKQVKQVLPERQRAGTVFGKAARGTNPSDVTDRDMSR